MQFRKLFLLPALIVASITAHAQEISEAIEKFEAAQVSHYDNEALERVIAGLELKQEETSPKEDPHVEYISSRYNVPRQEAMQIVANARKYADPVFPKYEDIMAIAEVESSFNRKAKSKGDCLGLMQLKYAYHKATIRAKRELFDIETNMRIATSYLRDLFSQPKVNNRSRVYSSYNTGLGAFLKGKRNKVYAAKVQKARKNYV
jgi:membrane-bound lytic murein transglycosylase MltF